MSLSKNPNATQAEARSFIETYDANRDNVISKKEMFKIIKTMLSRSL